jgi:hypothetical protein
MRFAFVAALAAPLLFAAASAGEAAFPDYEVTPLTKADLDLYLGIMHAAADHNAHLTADDKAAVDLTIQIQKHPPPPITGMPTPAQMQVLTHNSNLLARGKKIEAALRSDKPLVAPHVAEIAALKKQIGGFMFGGQ